MRIKRNRNNPKVRFSWLFRKQRIRYNGGKSPKGYKTVSFEFYCESLQGSIEVEQYEIDGKMYVAVYKTPYIQNLEGEVISDDENEVALYAAEYLLKNEPCHTKSACDSKKQYMRENK